MAPIDSAQQQSLMQLQLHPLLHASAVAVAFAIAAATSGTVHIAAGGAVTTTTATAAALANAIPVTQPAVCALLALLLGAFVVLLRARARLT